ncbi:MAG: hypothetical protein JXJ04_14060 [Spirochaetales bacterium]|nr:hypothetical protein [Spirochaetales bacterium]
MKNKFYYLGLILIPLLFFQSCNKQDEKTKGTATKAAEYEINKEYTSGPCTFTIYIDKKEITIAQSIIMILEVKVDKEYQITLPKFGENLQQFKIIDFYDKGQRLVDDKQIIATQEYKLEPYLSGEYKIPPLQITFRTEDEDPDKPHVLESEEITITVTSILEEDMKDLAIKDITGPVLPPPPDYTWLILLIFGIIAAGGGITVLIVILRKKSQGEKQIITIPAHEYAYRQLEMLIARNYIEKEEYKLFYIGISNILRSYIENRFFLHAPEETTEEFLNELKTSDLLSPELKTILKEFLYHCDLVKFARHTPTTSEIQKTFDTCKDFIVTTEDINTRIEEPGTLSPPVAAQETEVD